MECVSRYSRVQYLNTDRPRRKSGETKHTTSTEPSIDHLPPSNPPRRFSHTCILPNPLFTWSADPPRQHTHRSAARSPYRNRALTPPMSTPHHTTPHHHPHIHTSIHTSVHHHPSSTCPSTQRNPPRYLTSPHVPLILHHSSFTLLSRHRPNFPCLPSTIVLCSTRLHAPSDSGGAPVRT